MRALSRNELSQPPAPVVVDVLELDELLELDGVDADELVEAAVELVDEVVADVVVVVDDVDPLGLHALSWIVPPLNAKVEQTSLSGHA